MGISLSTAVGQLPWETDFETQMSTKAAQEVVSSTCGKEGCKQDMVSQNNSATPRETLQLGPSGGLLVGEN